jgi:ABC-type dipeptide/oligopeptide/nickel transport system ATPase subunit
LTYLLVTHSLPVVGFMCDRLGVLRHGGLVEEAPVATLKSGKFATSYARELYDASLGSGERGRDVAVVTPDLKGVSM